MVFLENYTCKGEVNAGCTFDIELRAATDKARHGQSHYREVPRWEIFMEQELRFGLDLGWYRRH